MTGAGGAGPGAGSRSGLAGAVWLVALARAALALVATRGDGYFRDEFYYLACARRLAWGYVDHPPLSVAVLAATRAALGDGLLAIRLPAIVAGSAAVVLAGLLVRVFGGGRAAQGLGALGVAVMGTSLAFASYFSMNAFDQVFWLLGTLVAACILAGGDRRLWLVWGVIVGLGLLNKLSMGFFVVGLGTGLLLSAARDHLRSRWFAAGLAVAGLIVAPHVAWQVAHGFPTLEFMRNAQAGKILGRGPLGFLGVQVLQANPATLPLWAAGLVALLGAPALRRWRPFGIGFLAVLALLLVQQGKPYYLAPAYPPLLAAGAVVIERRAMRTGRRRVVAVLAGVLVAGGAVVSLLTLPLLPPAAYVRLVAATGIGVPREERHETGALPQLLADRHGWENLAATVARVWEGLPAADRSRAVILAANYGQAGALEFYGPRYGLPPVLSGHNNYWLWGPGPATGEVVIVVGYRPEEVGGYCRSLVPAATVESAYVLPRENHLPVTVCRGVRVPLGELWPRLRRFI